METLEKLALFELFRHPLRNLLEEVWQYKGNARNIKTLPYDFLYEAGAALSKHDATFINTLLLYQTDDTILLQQINFLAYVKDKAGRDRFYHQSNFPFFSKNMLDEDEVFRFFCTLLNDSKPAAYYAGHEKPFKENFRLQIKKWQNLRPILAGYLENIRKGKPWNS